MMHHAFLNWPLKSWLIRLAKRYGNEYIITMKEGKSENKIPRFPWTKDGKIHKKKLAKIWKRNIEMKFWVKEKWISMDKPKSELPIYDRPKGNKGRNFKPYQE